MHPRKPSALDGAICTNKDPSYYPASEGEGEGVQEVYGGQQQIHVLPTKLDPACEVWGGGEGAVAASTGPVRYGGGPVRYGAGGAGRRGRQRQQLAQGVGGAC